MIMGYGEGVLLVKESGLTPCRMDVQVSAATLEMIHYTIDLDEVACGVTLACEALAFSSSLLMNVPAPRPILPGYSPYSVMR